MALPTRNLNSLHFDATSDAQTGMVIVKGFTWTGSTATNNTLAFTNTAGEIVLGPYTSGITGQPLHIMFNPDTYIRTTGLITSTLSAGVVEVYI